MEHLQIRPFRPAERQALPIDDIVESGRPAIVRGLAADWPLIRKGLESPEAAIDYVMVMLQQRGLVASTSR